MSQDRPKDKTQTHRVVVDRNASSKTRRYTSHPFPPYKYVPGRHPHPTRDPEGHSFGQADSTQPLSPDSWQRCESYLYAIDLFNYGYWWEAHEALEPFWRAAGRNSRAGRFLQGLIQLAGAMLKYSTGSLNAARRLGAVGCAKLRDASGVVFGLDTASLAADAESFLAGARQSPPTLRLEPYDRPNAL